MIARIHTAVVPVRKMIHGLLVRIGRHHPQALMYPLLVACKSQSHSRRAAAMGVVDNVRHHSATLVQQAQLVPPPPRPPPPPPFPPALHRPFSAVAPYAVRIQGAVRFSALQSEAAG